MKLISEDNKKGHPRRLKIRDSILIGGLGILIPCTVVFAQAPDNSKTNQQDRSPATADQQTENAPKDRCPATKRKPRSNLKR